MRSGDFVWGALCRVLPILGMVFLIFLVFVVFRRVYRETHAGEVCRERCWPYVVQQCDVEWGEAVPKKVYCFNADGGVENK